MATPVSIVIPVRDQLHLTKGILEQLRAMLGWDWCFVFDNGSTDGTAEYVDGLQNCMIERIEVPERTIYEMWNDGWLEALEKYGWDSYVAFLNNDITLKKDSLEFMREALDADPDLWVVSPDYNAPMDASRTGEIIRCWGSYRHGGIPGWCFMVRADVLAKGVPMFNTGYKWWAGDDQFFADVKRAGGKLGRIQGLGLDHLNEGTAAAHPELHALKEADMQRFERLNSD